jgi:3-hydroxyacyl-[acyl-carrier-protein] dehydratase
MDTGSTLQSMIEVAEDHPAFAGHFPGFPVLPGAVLLDEVLQAVQSQRGIDLAQWRITSAKFFGPVRPGDSLHLVHEISKNGSIRFILSTADRPVASGSLAGAVSPVDTP